MHWNKPTSKAVIKTTIPDTKMLMTTKTHTIIITTRTKINILKLRAPQKIATKKDLDIHSSSKNNRSTILINLLHWEENLNTLLNSTDSSKKPKIMSHKFVTDTRKVWLPSPNKVVKESKIMLMQAKDTIIVTPKGWLSVDMSKKAIWQENNYVTQEAHSNT